MTDLDEEKISQNIEKYSSNKLADMIIAHRYLGLFKGACLLAMEELNKRREAGDTFAYESYIAEGTSSLPKLDFSKGISMATLMEMAKKAKV